ncbi:MAG: fumarate hydratase C-terminal domain-containing protein [Candidatus Omnitrophica bacterium]|nr:fumarate hydratase C-terminal domain-containing protein [Candidatus Omnitrophota bacterium]
MHTKRINTPLDHRQIAGLRSGEEVLLSGVIYTARDQAHKRLAEQIKKRVKLPFVLKGQAIYYCGPTKTPKGKAIGSCGPTTSKRMDEFTPALLKHGLKGMIGKGSRDKEVVAAIKKNKAVYFLAFAGCGALVSKYVKSARPIAYKELGPEAIYELKVKDLPLIVGIDSKGKDVFEKYKHQYKTI